MQLHTRTRHNKDTLDKTQTKLQLLGMVCPCIDRLTQRSLYWCPTSLPRVGPNLSSGSLDDISGHSIWYSERKPAVAAVGLIARGDASVVDYLPLLAEDRVLLRLKVNLCYILSALFSNNIFNLYQNSHLG